MTAELLMLEFYEDTPQAGEMEELHLWARGNCGKVVKLIFVPGDGWIYHPRVEKALIK